MKMCRYIYLFILVFIIFNTIRYRIRFRIAFYFKLVELPGAAQVTQSYSRRLPALGIKLRFLMKVDPLNLKLLNLVTNIPVALPSFPKN